MIELKEKYRIPVMVILLVISSFLTYLFHAVLRTGIVFSHFFYIPIIVASLWWERKGLVVVIFLAGLLLLSDVFFKMPVYDDVPRIFVFMGVGFLVAVLSETIVKGDKLVNERTSELQESEAKYRTLYESSSDAIMLLDEKSFFDCNNATLLMFGFLKKEDFVKMHPADVSPPYQPDGTDSLTAANNKISEALRKGMNSFEWMHRRKNGEDFPVEVLLTAFRFNGKKVLQASVRDITERKKIEEALKSARDEAEKANMAKTNFLESMSHELRTPMNVIISFAEMLKQENSGQLNENQERFIDNIIEGGNNLHNIVSPILDMVMIEEGTLELHIEKMPLTETVEGAIAVIEKKAAKKNLFLEKNFDPELEYIEADKQKFKQVFINLLDNAVKFSKQEGGTVTIMVKKEGDMARFSVSDTGIGITEDDLGKLFRKFTQLDTGTNRKYGGTGIGLAISKLFVEMHGGRIWAQSRYGEGSTFTFLLPLKMGKESTQNK